VDGLFASVRFFRRTIPSPWKGCAQGSWARYRHSTGAEIRYVLESQDAESYTMRKERIENGKVDSETVKRSLLARDNPKSEGEEGEETLRTPKGDLRCRWIRKTTKRGWVKEWSSDEVPFRTVRTESEEDDIRRILELVDFERK
jgi:hypothetical protein